MGGTGANQFTAEASDRWRKYPTNFLYSGNVSSSSISCRGSLGYYWSSTANNTNSSYNLFLNSSDVYLGTDHYNKDNGLTARCVLGP